MILSQDILTKLQRIVGADMRSLERNLMVGDAGRYEVFGNYEIHDHGTEAHVYHNGDLRFIASDTRSAVSWCVAERHKQHELSNEILRLDQQKHRVERDINNTRMMLPRITSTDLRSTVIDKLHVKEQVLSNVKNRLSNCINRAKYIQIRGFNDEIARTRQSQPICSNSAGSR